MPTQTMATGGDEASPATGASAVEEEAIANLWPALSSNVDSSLIQQTGGGLR